jgi:hypothetical protein
MSDARPDPSAHLPVNREELIKYIENVFDLAASLDSMAGFLLRLTAKALKEENFDETNRRPH